MKTTAGLVIIAIGAIFAFAVTTNTSVLNLHTVGWVLIVVGVAVKVLPKRSYGWLSTKVIRRTRPRPGGGTRMEETTYPTYVVHEPESQRVRAGLTAPKEDEVVEEVYEEE
jgi:hypothetical protein